MYVCLCRGVTERQVEQALEGGACSLGDLHHELGVGSDCGRCRCKAREMLHRHLALSASAQKPSQPVHIYRLHKRQRAAGTDTPLPSQAVA